MARLMASRCFCLIERSTYSRPASEKLFLLVLEIAHAEFDGSNLTREGVRDVTAIVDTEKSFLSPGEEGKAVSSLRMKLTFKHEIKVT